MKFQKNYVISGEIICRTGLHIGGSKDSIEIGGSDNVIIRDPVTRLPYIPGSSIKGKMRALLELALDRVTNGGPCKCGECDVCRVFGSAADNTSVSGPTRIIVRDSFPTEETMEMWRKSTDVVEGAELKYENSLDRITSRANPRNQERVPRGSKFGFEIIVSEYEGDSDNLGVVLEGLRLLEDSYLGGSGTRGYGKVEFRDITITERPSEYYRGEASENTLGNFEALANIQLSEE
ncbi:type III-A CRISPR-associated RAMP protein Csm3 [Methanothermobacter sp. K4]|uniref:type III-A CRISPR-associated RAMP protein Csm3 n=1 Tax=Methanothermobacter sp. K4 TaxID=2913262 RepID=UPI001EDA152C|nr:type III-A CRISPR-associated RAMP protein Csm3 [Methanothermobacter sp. K4]MCG2828254.1 type III-A CRISPR-associated RAMP protein Csm3 [Methanothermobacter sp. K4]